MVKHPFPDVLSLRQLSAYLQIPKSTVYRLVQNKKLPGKKVGRQWRFSRQAIDEWLSGNDRVEGGGR